MKVHKDEIMLYYDARQMNERAAYAYGESFKGYKVKTFDVSKEPLTPWQLVALAEKLGVRNSELMDTTTPHYRMLYKDAAPNEESVLKLLVVHPELLKTPIVEFHDHASMLKSSDEMVQQERL